MKIKTYAISLISIALVISLSACGGKSNVEEKKPSTSEEATTSTTSPKPPTEAEATKALASYSKTLSVDDRKFYPNILKDSQSVAAAVSKHFLATGLDSTATTEADYHKVLMPIPTLTKEAVAFVRRDVLSDKAYGINITTIPPVSSVVLCINLPDKGGKDYYIYPGDCLDRFIK